MKLQRSSKLRLKYANGGKLDYLFSLFGGTVDHYCHELVNDLIYANKVPAMIPKDMLERLPFPARLSQLIGKECSSVARSIRSKLKKIPRHEGANLQKYQQELLDKFMSKTLTVKGIGSFNLDNRFVLIVPDDGSTSFDYWIQFKLPNSRGWVNIPFRKTKHIQSLLDRGFMLKSNILRIRRNGEIELIFTKDVELNSNHREIGIDVGRNKAFVTSDGTMETLSKDILNALRAKQHGSKNKASAIRRMRQAIDLEIKKIDFKTIGSIRMENLTGMKPGKKWGNTNHHWSYQYIQNRIRLHAEEHGVRVSHVNPRYTSQTCSECGHRERSNRKGERFSCTGCGMEMDADLNAAINIRNGGTNSAHCHKKPVDTFSDSG